MQYSERVVSLVVSRETSAANKVFDSNEASVSRETLKKYFFGKKIIDK